MLKLYIVKGNRKRSIDVAKLTELVWRYGIIHSTACGTLLYLGVSHGVCKDENGVYQLRNHTLRIERE